jgi:oxygen-independent coproporphyrinogen III oxidase
VDFRHATIDRKGQILDTLGIYVAVPFCRSKCTYCNFASGVYPQSYHEEYVERLIRDIQNAQVWAQEQGAVLPQIVDSIYFGGGTPSILSPDLIRRLFSSLRREFLLLPTAEITLEAAPGQIEDATLDAAVESGVNRISFGVQSFIDREAAVSGRLHTRQAALKDISRVRERGIRSLNVDLIAGLAHQTLDSWRESLAVLVETDVPHASVYMLEVDEDSRLGRELLVHGSRYHAAAIPQDDDIAEMYSIAIETLASVGVKQYEISNFAHAGFASRHNRKYWERKAYLGLGVDASSMLELPGGEILRATTSDDLKEYLSGNAKPEVQRLGLPEQLEEAWFLGLRLMDGVSQDELTGEFGTEAVAPTLSVAQELAVAGLLKCIDGRWSLSSRGKLLSNEVFQSFLGLPQSDNLKVFPVLA